MKVSRAICVALVVCAAVVSADILSMFLYNDQYCSDLGMISVSYLPVCSAMPCMHYAGLNYRTSCGMPSLPTVPSITTAVYSDSRCGGNWTNVAWIATKKCVRAPNQQTGANSAMAICNAQTPTAWTFATVDCTGSPLTTTQMPVGMCYNNSLVKCTF